MVTVYYGILDRKREFFCLFFSNLFRNLLFFFFGLICRTLLVRVPDDPSKQATNSNNANRHSMYKN